MYSGLRTRFLYSLCVIQIKLGTSWKSNGQRVFVLKQWRQWDLKARHRLKWFLSQWCWWINRLLDWSFCTMGNLLPRCHWLKLIASFCLWALHWQTKRSWPECSVSVIITASGSRTEDGDVTIWGLLHIPGSDQNLQQSQMTYDCTLNARKCHWLHLHTQHKPDMLPIGLWLFWHGNAHICF